MDNMSTSPRIVFFGTPELCIPILEALDAHNYTPAHIITNPDRPVGRKQILTPPPVKVWALEYDIPCSQPQKLDDEFYAWYADQNFDIAIVVAYGKIIPERVIGAPTHGTLNIHYSLLPRWRGASPVEAALLHDDPATGVCIQKMVYELDAGDILAQTELPIHISDTTHSLLSRLNEEGARLLVSLLDPYMNSDITPTSQDKDKVTHCTKIKKSDGEVNLDTMSDRELWNRYRAYIGWPGIFYFDENGKRVKISQASFDDGVFVIEKVIPEGKKEVGFIEWRRNNT